MTMMLRRVVLIDGQKEEEEEGKQATTSRCSITHANEINSVTNSHEKEGNPRT